MATIAATAPSRLRLALQTARAAIERFERERKLPITGRFSDRLARELTALTGRPLE